MEAKYEGWGYETVDQMISLQEQNGMAYHGDIDIDHPHNEIDSFFEEVPEDPTELLTPSCC